MEPFTMTLQSCTDRLGRGVGAATTRLHDLNAYADLNYAILSYSTPFGIVPPVAPVYVDHIREGPAQARWLYRPYSVRL